MAFDTTLARGGFGEPNDTTLMQYRVFYQQYVSVLARANVDTQTNWLNDIRTYWGPQIETYAAFSGMSQHARKRLLQFARCQIEVSVWSFMALGPRAPETFIIDVNKDNFDRLPDRFVDAILMRSEFNHITERGDDPALAAIALTSLGLPSTPEALYKDHDDATARAVLSFLRIYGSAYESIVNADDNELDYQDVATGARFSAASRHDRTFMDFMEFHSWMAEAAYWHVSPTDLFDEITQEDVGTDALDATQAEALELFSLLRGVGTVGGNQRHMDMPKALHFAELAGYGYLPSMVVRAVQVVRTRDILDDAGEVLQGISIFGAFPPVLGSHPQRDTFIENGLLQNFVQFLQVIDGHTPDFIEIVVDIEQPAPGVQWVDLTNIVVLDADTFTMVPVLDVGGKTRWTITATKAAKWSYPNGAAGGSFNFVHGAHLKASPSKGIELELVSLTVMDGATDLSAYYEHMTNRFLSGLQLPPTKTPTFPQRASGAYFD